MTAGDQGNRVPTRHNTTSRRWLPPVIPTAAIFGIAALFLPVPAWVSVFVITQAVVLAGLAQLQRPAPEEPAESLMRSEDREQLMWAALTRECRRATRLGTSVAVFAIELNVAQAEDAVDVLSSSIRETDLVVIGPEPHTLLASLVIPDVQAAPSTLQRLSTILAGADMEIRSSGVSVFPEDHVTPDELVNLALRRMCSSSDEEAADSDGDGSESPLTESSSQASVARTPPHQASSRSVGAFLWRVFEFTIASVALILFAPVIGIAAIAIRLHDRGPAFFVQKRSGLNGREFDLYKLRSMSVGAEHRLDEVADLNEIEGTFKSSKDPRVTRVGRFLRRSSIDELPQLWNVVRGEMALVGPRPSSNLAATHLPWELERLTMKPGITGLWQVRHRGQLSFNDRARLDIQYARDRSSWLDVKILAQTIPAVLTSRGRH